MPVAAEPPARPVLKARATLRLAALMAVSVALLSLGAMMLQYRLVAARLTEAQKVLLLSDLQALGALYEQRRIIALRQAIDYRSASGGDEMLLLTDRSGQPGALLCATPFIRPTA